VVFKILTEELAKNIVKKIISILGKNINIIDDKGIIMASGDESRIGSFHEGAENAINFNRTIEVNVEENRYKPYGNVKPGVNIPIYFKNRIVGVVGITGNPEEIRGYGELVRQMVEMMLEQNLLRQQAHFEEETRKALIQDLISGNFGENLHIFFMRGERIGYNLHLPRIVVIFEIKNSMIDSNYISKDLQIDIGNGVVIQKLKNKALTIIKSIYKYNPNHIIEFISPNRIILLKAIELWTDDFKIEEILEKEIDDCLKTIFNTTGLTFQVGIGEKCSELWEFTDSYKNSIRALNIGRSVLPHENIFFINHLQYANIINYIPNNLSENFIKEILAPLIDSNNKSANYYLIKTLDVLFKNNLNISKCARELFIHRNTMLFRLEKIQKLTGLNPTNFKHAVLLHLALNLYYLSNNIKKE